MRAQRVLLLIGSLRIGGAERQSVVLANGLAAAGIEVSVGYAAPEHHLRDMLEATVRARTFCLDKAGRFDLRILFRLWRRLRQLRPDVIICVNLYPFILAGMVRPGLRGPRPVLMPVVHATILETRVERFMARWLFRPLIERPAVRAVFLSHGQLDFWRHHYGIRGGSPQVICNGVDTQQFAPPAAPGAGGRQPVLAICAALRPEKRHLDFLHAVRQLVDEGLDLRALLIGDGPERPRIEAYCREHALLDRCRITGFQMDVRPWLASADVCLLTSSTETFPMALLEAMSMGKPVVGPAVGGIPEQIEDGVNGLLFEPADPGSLVDVLRRMLTAGEDRLRAMGRAGRQRVLKQFAEDRMVANYLRTLQAIGLRT